MRILTHPHHLSEWKTKILDDRSSAQKTIAVDLPATGRKFPGQSQIPFYQKQTRILTEHHLRLDPERIEDYVVLDGYQALAKALFDMTSEAVIAEIKASGLRGRSGAGFPTGKKWELAHAAPGHPKYIVCQAGSSEPGAFADRCLLEGNPHSIIEGMLIGAYAAGASEGFLCIQMESPLAAKRAEIALEQARKHGLLGKSILGSEFHLEINVVRGAGEFFSVDETSLLAAIEGRKAFPCQRPPYPTQEGLWGKPTVIHAAETWANVPVILIRSAAWYKTIGTEQSKGTKIFSLAGQARHGGLVEVPFGTSLRKIIFDIGGGLKDHRSLKAVQTGSPTGGCLPADRINLTVDFESLSQAGLTMGSGGLIVMDDKTCMVGLAKNAMGFSRSGSCGKCVPCRVGTQQMFGMLDRITKGQGREGDIERLEDLAKTVQETSLCRLGQMAPYPVLTTIRYFRDEYAAHIKKKECPARACSGLNGAKRTDRSRRRSRRTRREPK